MMADQSMNSFVPAIPEILVLVMMGVIMLADLFIKNNTQRIVYTLSQLTVVAAAAFTWHGMGQTDIVFNQQFIFDDLAYVLKLTMYLLTFGVFLYSHRYVTHKKLAYGEFHLLILLSLLGGMVLVSANSMLTLYLGLELLSLPQYALVALMRDETKAPEAAMKYFVTGALASALLLYGISLIYGATGSLILSNIAAHLSYDAARTPLMVFGLIFLIVGIGFKFGAVPFHMWVPDLYEGAPTAVTTFIGTVPKLAGFAMMIRLLYQTFPLMEPNWAPVLTALAVLSLILGNLIAIAQKNIKRMFAYSAIGHMGYIFLAMSLGTLEGYQSALFYTIAYTLMSLGGLGLITLLEATGQRFDSIEGLRGLNSRNPWLALMMMFLLLSMAGVPPFLGFDAKMWIILGLIHQSSYALTTVVVVMAVIAAYYYLRVIKVMYFDAPSVKEPLHIAKDGAVGITINAIGVLALGCLPGALMAICQGVFG